MKNINTAILVICLFVFSCFANSKKVAEKKMKISPNEIKNSPRLIQSKISEKLKEKIKMKGKAKKSQKIKQEPVSNTENQTQPSEPNQTEAVTVQPSNTSETKYQSGQNPPSENDKFFYKKNIQCSDKNCYPPMGTCVDNNTTCKCLDGYAEFVPEGKETYGYYCSYQQKKQLVAFLLEFFLSSGVGHFYSGRTLMGVLKLLVCLAPIFISILMCCAVLSNDKGTCLGLCVTITSCGFVCAALVWQLVDVILFGINNYPDGNGVPLQRW